jgi:PAS domain S-box-containing protein
MASELRKTGISVVGDMPWGTHFCHFYETKQDLLDTLVPYFKAGLESKEFCLWVVSNSELLTVEEAKVALAQAVPDLDRHLSDGNIEILDGHEWYFEKNVLTLERVASAWDAKVKRALARGYDGLRASADTFWLAEKDWKDFFAYEKQVNDWITGQTMSVLCTYPLAKSGAAEVLDVVQAHQFAIARRQGEWEVIETPQLRQAKAEIKRLNEELEQRVIERTNELRVANEELRMEIAERKQAEGLLHAKEQEFRAIVENAPDHIARYDRSFRRTYVNPSFAKALGRPAEALTGKPIFSSLREAGADVKEDELAQIRQRCEEVFDTGQSCEFEVTVPMPTGPRFYSVRFFPELDLNGSVINVLGIARDMTERKQAEEALKKSQHRLEEAQRIAHVGHWERDLKTGLITWSDEIYRILGLPPPENDSPPTEWQHMIHSEDRERVSLVIEEAQRGVRRYDVEYRIVRPDGEVRFLHSQGDIIRDEQGRPVRAFGIAQDITERKQAEEKLKQSEGQLAEAQQIARVGSWNWDLQSNALNWSGELYRVFGVDPQTFNPAYEAVVMESIHAEDRALVRGVIESSLKTQEPFSFYYRIHRPDGEERVIHARGDVVSDEHGTPIRMFGTAQDVTERKKAEEALREAERKYRDIFENAGEGIFQSTPDGRYIAANPALARMYRFASPEELIHSCQDISQQVYVDPARREEFKRQLEEQGVIRGFEHEVFRKDGSRFWISVNARVVQDEQGAIQYYEGTAQDITERKAAEEKLKASSEQLRALSARLQSAREEEGTRISREIHDELGAALTSLKWDLESFDKIIAEAGDQSQRQLLRERLEGMLRLTETTISSVRRISSELRPSVLDDLGLAAAIEWQAQQFQARTGITCRCDCSLENLNLSREQSTAVFRIFQEALTNILRHAQATSVDITMQAEAGELVFAISDNGRGITEDEKSGSQSLGLLGMQERAQLIGAKLDVNSDAGKGTVVTVRVALSGSANH